MFNFVWNSLDFSHKYDANPTTASDVEFEKHYHNFYEVFLFVNGNVTYTVEQEKRTLEKGEVLIIKPGKFHNVEFGKTAPYERYVLKLPMAFIPPFLESKLANHGAFFKPQKQVTKLFNRLDELYNIYEGDELYFLYYGVAMEIIIQLCHFDAELNDADNTAQNKIVPILQYIDNNTTRHVTLEELSENFHYSTSRISHEFYEYMKTPIMKYIRTKRMLAAHKLILQGMKPTKVAEDMGFADYSTFYRSYLSVIGTPPSKV